MINPHPEIYYVSGGIIMTHSSSRILAVIFFTAFIVLTISAVISSAASYINIISNASGFGVQPLLLRIGEDGSPELKDMSASFQETIEVEGSLNLIVDMLSLKSNIKINVQSGQSDKLSVLVGAIDKSDRNTDISNIEYSNLENRITNNRNTNNRKMNKIKYILIEDEELNILKFVGTGPANLPVQIIDIIIPKKLKKVEIKAFNADINILNDCKSDILAKIDTGSLNIVGLSCKANVDINNGTVNLECIQILGGTTIKTKNGNITVKAEKFVYGEDIVIISKKGNINVTISDNQKLELFAEGIISDCSFPYNSSKTESYKADFTIKGESYYSKNENPYMPRVFVSCREGRIMIKKISAY